MEAGLVSGKLEAGKSGGKAGGMSKGEVMRLSLRGLEEEHIQGGINRNLVAGECVW